MKTLRKVNIALGIIIVLAALYHFFIDHLNIPMNIFFLFIAAQFFLSGIEDILKEKGDKLMGYIYISVSLLLCFLLIQEFVAVF